MINLPFGVLAATDLDPLIITSPTIRSGTTLLQRLLCSTSNAFIFGENCAQDLELFLRVYLSKSVMYSFNKRQFAETLGAFINGQTQGWIIDLMPDIDEYLRTLSKSCLAGIAYCRDYAIKAGRPVWGFKYPGLQPQSLQLMRQMMRRGKILYIHRDIVDCVKSAKARGTLISVEEMREFCQQWVSHISLMLGMAEDPAILILSYRDLMSRPEETIGWIEKFTGLEDIRRDVLRLKVNAWDFESAKARDGYIAPADLTEKEMEVINHVASALRSQLYA